MGIQEYCDTRYTENSRPSKRQIIKLICEGELPGIKRGKFYYIDIEKENNQTGDPLVDSVLRAL